MKCKYCALKQLPGFVGQGFCRFHWAGQLWGTPGKVPETMRTEWLLTLRKLEGLKMKT